MSRHTRRLPSALQYAALIAVLATYGLTGVLRYSLHSVFDCEHCVAGITCSEQASHCSHLHEHDAAYLSTAAQPKAAKTQSRANSILFNSDESCTLCAFLAQAQSPFVLFHDVEQVAFLSAERPASDYFSEPLSYGYSLARGPPVAS